MSFVTMTCPDCQRSVLLDEVEGKGFCMYCGNALDTGNGYTQIPDSYLDILTSILEFVDEMDLRKSPWYEDLKGVVDLMDAGDYAGAGTELAKRLKGKTPEDRDSVRHEATKQMIHYVLDGAISGNPYEGGLLPLMYNLILECEEDPPTPAELLVMLVDGITSFDRIASDDEAAYGTALSAIRLTADLFEVETDIRLECICLGKVSDLISGLSEAVSDVYPDSEYIEELEVLYDFVNAILDEWMGVLYDMDDDKLSAIVEGHATDERRATDLLTRIDEEDVLDDEFWERLANDAAAYVDEYVKH